MEIISFILFLSVLVYIFFGFYIFRLNPSAAPNRLFGLVCACMAVRGTAYMIMHSLAVKEDIWFWYILSMPARIFFSAFLAHFFLCFSRSEWLKKRLVYLLYSPGMLFLAYGMAGGDIGAEDFVRWNGYWAEVFKGEDPVNVLYYLWHVTLLSLVFILITRWRRAAGDIHERKQAHLALISGIPTVFFGVASNIVLPFSGIYHPNLITVAGVIWITGTAFAVYEHGFLHITPATAPASVLSSLPDAVILTDIKGNVNWVNNAAAALTGFSLREIRGRKVEELFERGTITEDNGVPREAGAARKKGGAVPVLVSRSAIKKGIKKLGWAYSMRDITDRKKAEDALRRSERENRSIVEVMPDTIFRLDREGNCIDVKAWEGSVCAGPGETLAGKNIKEVFPPEQADLLLDAVEKAVEAGGVRIVEYEMGVSGMSLVFEARISASDENEAVCFIRDVTDRKRMEKKLRRLTFQDSLTGLYNRTFVKEEIERLDTKRQLPISFIICDVDGLKKINDAQGHQAGDNLIQKSAEAIKGSCRSGDIIARWGGDEFLIMLPQTCKTEAENIIGRIREISSRGERGRCTVSLSMGAASKETESEDISRVIKEADEMMYADKRRKNRNGTL